MYKCREMVEEFCVMDAPMREFFKRQAKNATTLLLSGPQDNPYTWTVVNRATSLHFRCMPQEERALGMKVARAFKAKYGALPSVINGKSPLMDAAGAARAMNVYTEARSAANSLTTKSARSLQRHAWERTYFKVVILITALPRMTRTFKSGGETNSG